MPLMPYDQALEQLVQQLIPTIKTEYVPILQAQGRVLAEAVVAQHDAPNFDNSAMDGYAICGVDEVNWQLVDYVAAGDSALNIHLNVGQAVRVFTGSAIPQGTHAVIAQEDVDVIENCISSRVDVQPQQHIRFQAEEFAQGSILIAAQQQLNATHIGIIASQGLSEVLCYQPLKVSIFSSGNELQVLGQALLENQIYDSNRYMLLALLAQKSFLKVTDGGVLPDQLDTIQQQLAQAAQDSDVILISGGASVGDKDFTKQALENLGEMQHWKLAIKPGKPFAWGSIHSDTQHSKVFILPGNPVACWVTYLVMTLPALNMMAGIDLARALPKKVLAQAQFEMSKTQSRLQFLRGNVEVNAGQLHAHIHALQSSAMLANCGMTNALVIIPQGETVTFGQNIQIMYLNSI